MEWVLILVSFNLPRRRGSQAMERIEKTVFISYRRTNFPWALAIFQDLSSAWTMKFPP